jgi:hypothetical protein
MIKFTFLKITRDFAVGLNFQENFKIFGISSK